MNGSFYTAALGAGSNQAKLNVLANNIANINTVGFRAKKPVFTDLMQYNLNAPPDQQTNLRTGVGIRLEKADTDFVQGRFEPTGQPQDYAIMGDGFFSILDPETQETYYTRDGSFSLSEREDGMYLASSDGCLVLDPNSQPIIVTDRMARQNVGIFLFPNRNGMTNIGDNRFTPIEKNGLPVADNNDIMTMRQGYVEMSNVDYGEQISEVIKAQRGNQYALRMVQTSDEIENTINSLRA